MFATLCGSVVQNMAIPRGGHLLGGMGFPARALDGSFRFRRFLSGPRAFRFLVGGVGAHVLSFLLTSFLLFCIAMIACMFFVLAVHDALPSQANIEEFEISLLCE